MKKFFYISIICSLLLSGCSKADIQDFSSESSSLASDQTLVSPENEQSSLPETDFSDNTYNEDDVQGNTDNKDDIQKEDAPDDKIFMNTVMPLPSEYSQNEADLMSMDYCFTKTAIDTDVSAIGDGEVVGAGWLNELGRTVIIRHSDRIALYFHLNDYTVKTGDTVSSGELIGHTGSSGYTTKIGLGYMVVTDEKLSELMTAFSDGNSTVISRSTENYNLDLFYGAYSDGSITQDITLRLTDSDNNVYERQAVSPALGGDNSLPDGCDFKLIVSETNVFPAFAAMLVPITIHDEVAYYTTLYCFNGEALEMYFPKDQIGQFFPLIYDVDSIVIGEDSFSYCDEDGNAMSIELSADYLDDM